MKTGPCLENTAPTHGRCIKGLSFSSFSLKQTKEALQITASYLFNILLVIFFMTNYDECAFLPCRLSLGACCGDDHNIQPLTFSH